MATVPLRITWVNLADSATLSVSSATATLPAGNLLTEDIQDVWRATASPANVVADLGSIKSIGVIGLINSNAGIADAVQFGVSTSDATGAARDAYDSGSIAAPIDPAYGMLLQFVEPAVSGRYVRIDLSQSSVPSAGRLVVGATWTPSYHFSLVRPWQPLWRDLSRRSFSLGENLFFDRRPRQRGFRFVLRGLPGSEAHDEIHEVNRLNGTSSDILVCRDINESNLGKATVWGVMETTIAYQQSESDFFEAEFEVWNRL